MILKKNAELRTRMQYGETEMVIRRDIYLDKLISKKHNRLIKVITGIRRCGKSYLLFNLFRDHLSSENVADSHIVEMAFDLYENIEYRDPKVFFPYVQSRMDSKKSSSQKMLLPLYIAKREF